MVSAVSTHTFIARFDVLTTVVSQFVTLYSKAKVCVVQAFELLDDSTSRFSLFVGGGTGDAVHVGVIVGVRVFVCDRFGVKVKVGVEGFEIEII